MIAAAAATANFASRRRRFGAAISLIVGEFGENNEKDGDFLQFPFSPFSTKSTYRGRIIHIKQRKLRIFLDSHSCYYHQRAH
jgi:hypothetical protein